MPKVSVIIPIYGVEKYIERCARSLFEQTLDDMEFIFVDDCTTDNSISILENVINDYPNRATQTRICHHEKNMGLPIARQTGIKKASGNFIAHCDSDDWVDRDMYELMYTNAIHDNADIAVCDYYHDSGTEKTHITALHTTNKNEYLINLLYQIDSWAVWNKIVRASLYEGVVYPANNMGEDMAIMCQLVHKAQKITYCDKALYHYFLNPLSITKIVDKDKVLLSYQQAVANVKLVEIYFSQSVDTGILCGIDYLKFRQRNILYKLLREDKYYKIWSNAYTDINKRIFLDRKIPWKEKLVFVLFHFRLFRKCYCS